MNELHIQCPYCLQSITLLLDSGADDFATVIDDCEVCCRPIEISCSVNEGEITSYSIHTIEGNEF